jgi:aryl sulfotransferase
MTRPKLVRGPTREVRSRVMDNSRWDVITPRADDIIIATYPKCGTTWAQRIVGMLVFGSADPFDIHDVSLWPDRRIQPVEKVEAAAEAQTHRRFLKSHLPYDAHPVYEGTKFIHVTRDGRDAAMSFHNHKMAYTDRAFAAFDAISMGDAKFGDPMPRVDPDPGAHFRDWVLGPEDELGDPGASYFHMENSWWDARHNPEVLLVHYADLQTDLGGEMRRISEFLDITISENVWPQIIAAGDFGSMKKDFDKLMPSAGLIFEGGGDRFLHKGTNRRWDGVVAAEDLALYDAKVKEQFSPTLARWCEQGRLVADRISTS